MIRCPGTVARATPAYFLNEAIPLVEDSDLKTLLARYAAMPGLTYQDVAIILMQVLPDSTFDAWPSVTLQPPLDIPALSSFNNNFSREWWYFNVNGHVHEVSDSGKKGDASRFYMLRVLKRFRAKYPSGTENVPWLLHDTVSVFIDGAMHYSNSTCAPCYSYLDDSVVYPCFLVSGPDPGQVLYYEDASTSQASLVLKNGNLSSSYMPKDAVGFEINCRCNKSVLLQGPDLNGLDPGSDDVVSKVSGASYLYYSFPSWLIDKEGLKIVDPSKNKTYQGDPGSFQLWLDHQGGTVKAPKNRLIGELAIAIGARPLVFPGWNWFSIQFDDNSQFTGYSNKPWDNDTNNNKQMLKGSWFSKDGKLSWIHGSLTVDKWWRSPISNTPFGTEYTFYLGDKGTFTLKGIMDDQRTTEGGIENYEGGCDVYQGDKLVGVGNLECVGWPSISERVKFISKSLSSPLTSSETSTIERTLTPDMTRMRSLVIVLWILLGAIIVIPIVWYVKKRWCNWYGFLGIPVTLAVSALVVWLSLRLTRYLLCRKLMTCAIDYPSSGCLFNCKG